MTTAIAIVGAALAYPVIAGWAYRMMNRGVPPEPRRCNGDGLREFGTCAGDTHHGFAHINVHYPRLYCDACNEWLRWRVRVVVLPKSTAWLWPVIWIPALINRLFDAGANIEATPATPPTLPPEQRKKPSRSRAHRGDTERMSETRTLYKSGTPKEAP